jgi:signal transduction histidine kinase
MQIPVLPRDLAGRIITSSVSRMGWAVGAVTLLLTIPVLIETLARRDRIDELPLPLAMLGLMLIGIALVVVSGRPWGVFLFLALAGTASVVYDLALIVPDPHLLDHAVFLINRPAVALVTVGVTAVSPLVGVLWATLGYGVTWAVAAVVATVTDLPLRPGIGPTLVYAVVLIGYMTLAGIQAAQRRSLPDFEALEAETQRVALGEDLARKTTAMVHDTVLNDLALIINSPEHPSRRARDRLLEDLATLRSGEWLSSTATIQVGNRDDASLVNDLMRLISDFQWRGLSVHFTGPTRGGYRIDPDVARALLAAIRACLDNVVNHSGATTAELEVVYTETTITVMVTDRGTGFDPRAVPADRLGLRTSVVERIEAVGGRVEIWSAPGEGTSVIITAPARLLEVTTVRDGATADEVVE